MISMNDAIVSYRGWDGVRASFLVLDYLKPKETRMCVTSIRRHAKFPFKIYLLSNGARDRYPFDLYEEGLVDYLLLPKKNGGQALGTQDLFRVCDTEYAFYVQCDQIACRDITSVSVAGMISEIKQGGVKAFGLAGNVNQFAFSERANFMEVETYLTIREKPKGGPGIFDRTDIWLEEHIGNWFKTNGHKFAILEAPFFADIGKYSIRELPCGGVLRHRTDRGSVEVIVLPKRSHPGYDYSPEEWEDMIAGRWKNGRVPEKWKAGAFEFWDSNPYAKDL